MPLRPAVEAADPASGSGGATPVAESGSARDRADHDVEVVEETVPPTIVLDQTPPRPFEVPCCHAVVWVRST